MIRLVALDLDDTLLTPAGEISMQSRIVLQRVRDMGIVVTLATGRMFESAVQFARELSLDAPIITYQGALIKTGLTGEVLRSLHIAGEQARAVLRYLEGEPVHVNLYLDDGLHVCELNDVARGYASHVNVGIREAGRLSDLPLVDAVKIVAIGDPSYIRNHLLLRTQKLFGADLTVNTSRPHFLEIGHMDAKKSAALAFLGSRFGIRREEVLAIGDGQNDLDMIEYAGVGIAMGNADEEVKAVADYITATNDAEGVAKALRRFILEESIL